MRRWNSNAFFFVQLAGVRSFPTAPRLPLVGVRLVCVRLAMALAPVAHSMEMPWYGSPASHAPDPPRPSLLKSPATYPCLKSAMKSSTPKEAASVTFASPIEQAYELLDFAQTPVDDPMGLRCEEGLSDKQAKPVRISGTGAGPEIGRAHV